MDTAETSDRRHWHVDKSVSVGHILTTLLIAVSAFSWGSAVDQRVASNAQAIQYLSESINDTNSRFDTYRSDIRQDLRDINAKLDRIIESQGQ
ncbi:hypothetical protein [Saccharospirillum sp. MSK14-1]|uniref:hypothetical protein n=1 Tax=Saccharospirillum sp. MSK14-1 TaxID=1897632 RepID=UPI001E57E296|nr:hypothetical protein [Saccharospirillum sp. MSK14-1]